MFQVIDGRSDVMVAQPGVAQRPAILNPAGLSLFAFRILITTAPLRR